MPEFSRISLRQAIEHASTALAAVESALERAQATGATSLAEGLEKAAGDLALGVQQLRYEDQKLQYKAGHITLHPTEPRRP
jgi:HPt (histidine-containing phosphotransfer) domain-containing protein